ncbi:hypothetical protein FB562_0841 [Homoserinimonas aerilata]|uniref:Uncharacterized protein n=1 Tax=Homoserinimonas aerilata TaxID=1162970 RepID=A0A542YIE0_9MICO|nr:hypothetical protein [Homoserinimonas aerilata]TQL47771.1 hypothetical protein FB562_0841 [Homoserinimonas aerilata]
MSADKCLPVAVENFRGTSQLSATVERMPLRRTAVIAAITCTLALTACTTPAPTPKPSPTSSAPVFASDEEALAAAEQTMADYWVVMNTIFQEGGANPERIELHAEGRWLEKSISSANLLSKAGERQEGAITADSMELQQVFGRGLNTTVITYACNDFSAREVIDSDGRQVDLSGVRPRKGYQLTFSVDSLDPIVLKLTDTEYWEKKSC